MLKTYCLSTITMVAGTRLSVTSILTLPFFFGKYPIALAVAFCLPSAENHISLQVGSLLFRSLFCFSLLMSIPPLLRISVSVCS